MTDVVGEERGGVLVEDIDLQFVPVRGESVIAHEIDGQSVLIDVANGEVHVLNSIGSVIWSCFDGAADLGVLTDELADAFGAPADVVQNDVLTLTRNLAANGLLEGIATPEFTPPEGVVEVGEHLEPFTLTDLAGTSVDLADLRGGAVLLVNWSPACGFCLMIAPELGELCESLEANGTRLVLITAGPPEANRDVFEQSGLDTLTLTREDASDDFLDPFPGMGTPVAYLLDADGKVAAPLAYGAGEVPALARRTAGLPDTPVARTDVKYLPGAVEGMCGPGASSKKPRVWTANQNLRVGDYHVGVRADSEEAGAIVQRAFTSVLGEDDPDVPANYSVVLGEPVSGASKDLRLLLFANTTVVRSRSPRRVLHALAADLSGILPAPEGLLRTTNVAVVHDGDALLLPPTTIQIIERLQPRLARAGMQVVDEPYALIDVATAELVVPEPLISADPDVLAELDEPALSRAELARVEPGRFRLRGWVTWAAADADAPTRAELITGALMTVAAEPEELVDAIGDVEAMLERVPPVHVEPSRAEQMADVLKLHFARS